MIEDTRCVHQLVRYLTYTKAFYANCTFKSTLQGKFGFAFHSLLHWLNYDEKGEEKEKEKEKSCTESGEREREKEKEKKKKRKASSLHYIRSIKSQKALKYASTTRVHVR